MSNSSKEFVKSAFDEYCFGIKSLQMMHAEMKRVDNLINIKTSAINSDSSSGKRKDTLDRYNEIIEKKIRLENEIINCEDYISRVDDVLELLNSDYPVECMILKLKHIECRTIAQIESKLFFSRGKCFKVLRQAENEFERLMKLVS